MIICFASVITDKADKIFLIKRHRLLTFRYVVQIIQKGFKGTILNMDNKRSNVFVLNFLFENIFCPHHPAGVLCIMATSIYHVACIPWAWR